MIRFNRALSPVTVLSFDLDDTLYNNHPIIKSALQAQADYLAKLPEWPTNDTQYWLYCRDKALALDPSLIDDVTRWRSEEHTSELQSPCNLVLYQKKC